MPEINPLSNDQIFLKKIAENTGSDYNTGDVSEINPLTIDQILLKEIAANTAGQSGDITELEEKVTANAEAIEATQDMISDAYDSTHTYNVGDYCIYNDTLYKCNTDIATGEAFTPAKWTATNVAEEIKVKSITPAIGSAYSDLAILQDSQCFQIGKLVIVNLKLSIDSEIPTGNILIKDLPKGLTSLGVNSGFSAMACNLPDMFLFAVNTQDGGGGLLLGSRSTPPTATALIVSGCYIAE